MDHETTQREHAKRAAEHAPVTLTAQELHAKLGKLIEAGHGARPVYYMSEDAQGFTVAHGMTLCFDSQPYDGEVVWLC